MLGSGRRLWHSSWACTRYFEILISSNAFVTIIGRFVDDHLFSNNAMSRCVGKLVGNLPKVGGFSAPPLCCMLPKVEQLCVSGKFSIFWHFLTFIRPSIPYSSTPSTFFMSDSKRNSKWNVHLYNSMAFTLWIKKVQRANSPNKVTKSRHIKKIECSLMSSVLSRGVLFLQH